MDRSLSSGDPLAEHMSAEIRTRAEKEIASVRGVGLLALRLDAERHRFAAKGLVLAFCPGVHSRLYILRRDHSLWAHIWFCYDQFRLETERTSRRGNHVPLEMRRLSGDVELSARLVLEMVKNDRLPLGTGYKDRHLLSMRDLARSVVFKNRGRRLLAPARKCSAGVILEAVPGRDRRPWWHRLLF